MPTTKVARFFTILDSTNAEAIRLLRDHPLPPAWSSIRADYQTAGRGQATNTWFASPGQNLLFSVILYPELGAEEVFRLTQGLSIAVVAALSSCDLGFEGGGARDGATTSTRKNTAQKEGTAPARSARIGASAKKNIPFSFPISPDTDWLARATQSGLRIKWPNDIYLHDKKLAGMLIQNSWQGQQLQWTVMGVGLNVNETQFPAELADKASSLRLAAGPDAAALDRTLIFDTIMAYLPPIFDAYVNSRRFDALSDIYHQLLYRQGEMHRFRRLPEGATFVARVEGVTPAGLLKLQHPQGPTELFDLKTIAFL